MILEHPANFDGAQNRLFRIRAKHERAAVACWQAQQFAFRVGQTELLSPTHNFFQRLELLALLSDEQPRVSDNVDEQNVTDLKLHVGWRLGCHPFTNVVVDPKRSPHFAISKKEKFCSPIEI
jgi:hypothetical protein